MVQIDRIFPHKDRGAVAGFSGGDSAGRSPGRKHEKYESTLLELRNVLTTRARAIKSDFRKKLNQNSCERAVELENNEVLNSLLEDAVTQIQQIDHALARLQSGDYGSCMQCGSDINVARLLAFPQSTLCIQCAEGLEADA